MNVFLKTLKLDLDHDPSNGSLSKLNSVFLLTLYIIPASFMLICWVVFARSCSQTHTHTHTHRQTDRHTPTKTLYLRWWYNKSSRIYLQSLIHNAYSSTSPGFRHHIPDCYCFGITNIYIYIYIDTGAGLRGIDDQVSVRVSVTMYNNPWNKFK